MARRRIVEVPTSRLAVWSRRFAIFALAVAILSIVILRAGLVEILPGLATFGAALAVATIGILLAIGAFAVIWQEGVNGFGYALSAALIGIALLAYPTYLGIKGYGLPELADITTDTADPPRFEAIARLRPREANPPAYPGAKTAETQRATYPDIEPMDLSASPLEAYNAALAVISKRKWNVIEARTPQPRREGRIEAVARTPIMGFRDDVVVRVRPASGGARVDIRSASRYGTRDFGANAQRIRSLVEDIEEAAGAPPPKAQPAARR
jgi:uncharacterized protein (DUF1499 family)